MVDNNDNCTTLDRHDCLGNYVKLIVLHTHLLRLEFVLVRNPSNSRYFNVHYRCGIGINYCSEWTKVHCTV